MPITVTIRRNDIGRVRDQIKDKARAAVGDNAHYLQGYGAQIAPRQTGAFAASLYVNGPAGDSDYSQRAAEAQSRRPAAPMVGELQADSVVAPARDVDTAIVSTAVGYGILLEEGTAYMAPRPTLRQSAEVTRPRFIAAMSKVAD